MENSEEELFKSRIISAKNMGVNIADSVRLMTTIHFGSEPFLVTIKDNCVISYCVDFITHDGATRIIKNIDNKYSKCVSYGTITINENSFIGAHSIILPNVTIGPNSIIAAGSVVTKDVPPNSVYGGNPAKFIETLDDYAKHAMTKHTKLLPYNHKAPREIRLKQRLGLIEYTPK